MASCLKKCFWYLTNQGESWVWICRECEKAREGGKMYMCENRVKSWQCPGVYSKLRICPNSFNKRANPRHSKTDREGKKERAGGGGLLFACYIQRHLINLPGTQHNTHNTPRDVSVIPCSPMRFPLYLRLKVLSLPVPKSVIFWLSHTLSFYALLFCFFPLTRRIFLISTHSTPSESLSDFILMNPLWVHLDIQCVWIIQRVTLPSGDVRPPNIQTHLPAHFPKSYCTFLGKNNKNLWVCLCVCKHRMSSWGNQEQHKLINH